MSTNFVWVSCLGSIAGVPGVLISVVWAIVVDIKVGRPSGDKSDGLKVSDLLNGKAAAKLK